MHTTFIPGRVKFSLPGKKNTPKSWWKKVKINEKVTFFIRFRFPEPGTTHHT